MRSIRLLLIEGQALVRLGVGALVAKADDIHLIHEATDPVEGYRAFLTLEPDVTLLGLRFPDSCSIDDLERFLQVRPDAGAGAHPLHFVWQDRLAIAHGIAVRKLAGDHIRNDLHVAVAVFRKALIRLNPVLVNDPQIAESHEPRVVIIAE